MSEIEPNFNSSPAERMKELYPEYMMMIRYFVSEELVAVKDPSQKQQEWAHRASLGNEDLARALAGLARASESAHRQRMLEGMPMVIELDDPQGNDFEPIERFHFLRLFAKECRALEGYDLQTHRLDVPAVLQVSPEDVTD